MTSHFSLKSLTSSNTIVGTFAVPKYHEMNEIKEKIKELLEYGELNLNEIAYQLGYSSSAHLSAQFKSITALTPSQYKTKEFKNRKSIDRL